MFTVEKLVAFLKNVETFSSKEEVECVVSGYGLEIDSSTCVACPPVSKAMQLPHLFVHKYCGMEFLEHSKEEWQICQIVCKFVKENKKELEDETHDYFRAPTARSSSHPMHCKCSF